MALGKVLYQDKSHKHMDVQGFVNAFPELEEGLKKIQEDFGDFTDLTMTIAGTEYSFSKPPNQQIPDVNLSADTTCGCGNSYAFDIHKNPKCESL